MTTVPPSVPPRGLRIDLDLGDTRGILTEARAQGLLRNQTAYVLATAYWETARTLKPVRETLAASDDLAIAARDCAFAAGALDGVKQPYWRRDTDGKSWLGRGYVQLTHKGGYARAGAALGIDLLATPEQAMTPEIAAQILIQGMMQGWFTSHKLPAFVNADGSDFRRARRVVNGLDRAAKIAAIARAYDTALHAAAPARTGQSLRDALSRIWPGRKASHITRSGGATHRIHT